MGIIRSVATVGGYTMGSRVLGFVRDVLIARAIGTSPVADAFFVALRYPNMFRSLFAEGAFNSAFVPQFARRVEGEGLAAAKAFAEQVLSVLLVTLLVFTVAAQIGMPWLIYLIASGFANDPERLDLSILFTQITFPYLLFMSLTALQGGVLNSLHRFGQAAAAPILLNVVMILALVAVEPFTGMPGHVLAWAVAVAGVGQFLWMAIACHRAGVALRLPVPRLTPDVRRFLKLMLPGIVGAGVMQMNLIVGTQIASWLEDGSISYLYYADRIYQLPLGVIGAALGVVLLPELSRALRGGRDGEANNHLNRGLEYAALLTLPATVALVVVPFPIIVGVYEHGAFTREASAATAAALAAYSVGLPAYVLAKALTTCFFAREDTATPFRFGVVSMVANAALSLALFPVLAHVGIALATALASWLNVAMLGGRLRRDRHLALDGRLRGRLWRILFASAGMGAILWLAGRYLVGAFDGPLHVKVLALAGLVGAGLAAYCVLALAIGAVRLSDLRRGGLRPGGPEAGEGGAA